VLKETWWQRCSKLTQSALQSKWAFLILYIGALRVVVFPSTKRLLDSADMSFSLAFLAYSVTLGLLIRAVYLDLSKSTRFLNEGEWSRVKLRRAIRGAVLMAVYNLMLDYSERPLTRFSFMGAAVASGVIFLIVYFSKRPDSTGEEKMIDQENVGKLINERCPG
jgi:hypothetical protein